MMNTYEIETITNRYNDNLSDNAKETVTLDEFLETVDRIYNTLNRFADDRNSFYRISIAKNVMEWASNKWRILKAIKNHPGYNPAQPWKIILHTEMYRSMDLYQVRNYAETFRKQFTAYEDFGTVIEDGVMTRNQYFQTNTVFDTLLSEYIRNIDVTTVDNEGIAFFKKLLEAYKPGKEPGIFRKNNEDYWACPRWILTKDEYDLVCKRMPHNGEKASRYVRKLIQTLKAELDERKFAQFADAVNPLSYEAVYVLSADPVDYLLMSNGNSWSSCYYINYDEGDYHGMYSGGTWSYMNDGCTMIQYSVSEEQDEIAWKGKTLRQVTMYDIDSNRIAFSRLYPQSCDSGESEMYKTFRSLGQRVISELFDVPNYWRTFWYERDRQPNEFVTGDFTGYNDLGYFRTCVCYNVNECPDGIDFSNANREDLWQGDVCEYGNRIFCPDCGCEYGGGEVRYICESCDRANGREECEECGDLYDEEDLYYCEVDNMNVCRYCCTYDEYTETYYVTSRHDTYEVHTRYGTQTYVDYAVEEAQNNGDVFYCDCCDEYYSTHAYEEMEGPDGYAYCPDCFEEHCVVCAKCGEVIDKDDAIEYEGEYYCEDCAEEVKVTDDDDDEDDSVVED